ncbi:uncharacterized protein LOC103186011 isoform X2 [Callorhinchus milii]|uniref:uncharacterized protein LOC103186011 isoform X2 n=1 Tax=Callorhinchus milii TaxID=7868 RepID=UPI00045733D3|nr:uncharacterized protein LOC103186011 isoform X2 [Callorhinchus milii]|eukprot:gi/632973117/ref/XP_007902994.1/ PREDICTED: uncharacterized protein LOC103186011 isoform X2 [Callorhinchus milii]
MSLFSNKVDMGVKTIWQSVEFDRDEDGSDDSTETQELSEVDSEEALAVINWLNNYTVSSFFEPVDLMWIGLKRTYGCADVSIKNIMDSTRSKHQEFDYEEVDTSVDSLQRKAAAVRENSSLLEIKLQQLCRQIREDTTKKYKKIKPDLTKRLRKTSLTEKTGSLHLHSSNQSLYQMFEYVVAIVSDLEVMITDMVNAIEWPPSIEGVQERGPATSRKESEIRNSPQNTKSLSTVLEEVRKTLVDFNREYHQDSILTDEVFRQTDKAKDKMSNLVHQWEISQEQESSLHKMLGDFRAETNDVSISVIARGFSAEAVQQVLKKSTSSIAEEIHRLEESSYKEVRGWRQKVEDLRLQLHQEHFRCCAMESEIRLLRDEIIRLQKHLFYQQPTETFKKCDIEDIFRNICDICDRVQKLSQGPGVSSQSSRNSCSTPSAHRVRLAEEPTAEFSGDKNIRSHTNGN